MPLHLTAEACPRCRSSPGSCWQWSLGSTPRQTCPRWEKLRARLSCLLLCCCRKGGLTHSILCPALQRVAIGVLVVICVFVAGFAW